MSGCTSLALTWVVVAWLGVAVVAAVIFGRAARYGRKGTP